MSRQPLAEAPGWVQVNIDLAVASLAGQDEQAAPLTLSPGAGDLCFGPPEGADCLRVLWGHIFQFDAEISSREGTGTHPWPTSRHWPVRASFLAPTNAITAMLRFGENIVPLDLRGSTGQVPLWDYLEHYQELEPGTVVYEREAQVITLASVAQDAASGDLTLTFTTANDKENADFFPRVEAGASRVAVNGTVFDGLDDNNQGWRPVSVRAQGQTLAPGQRGSFTLRLPRMEGTGFVAPGYNDDADARPDAVLAQLSTGSARTGEPLPESASALPARFISFVRAKAERALWFPDLRASGVSITPFKPTAGDAVEMVVTLRNDGPRPAAASTAEVYVGGMLLATLNVPALAPGASVALRTPWVASASDERVRVIANASGAVEEPSSAGNDVTFILPASPLPDLVIASVTFGTETLQLGDEVVVSVKVTNQGAGRARNSRVQVFLGGATTPNFYLSYPALAPGKSVTAQFTWTASANPYTFRFVADGYGDVAESDDTNNEVVVQRTSTLLPDLLISPTYMLDNPAGGAFSFGLIVVNQGSGRSTAALMRL